MAADGLPRLNLLARPVLLGLARRALAPLADHASAALTARRIEHARLAQTELLKRISALKADVGITQEKALAAQRTAQQANLDWRLFAEGHPPAPVRRGLLQPRLTPSQRELERQRKLHLLLAQQTAQAAQSAHDKAESASRELLRLEGELEHSRRDRSGHELALREEVGAWVLELAAARNADEARQELSDLRRNLRGDAVIGALCVLVELFDAGADAARAALLDAAAIFEQHRDPALRVLEAWTALYSAGLAANAGAPQAGPVLTLSMAGAYPREQFTQPGLYRLYVLARILGGLGYDADPVAHDPLRATYAAVDAYSSADEQKSPGDGPAAPNDAFIRLMRANSLLRRGQCAETLALCANDSAGLQLPLRKRAPLPVLYDQVSAITLPSWPAPLAPQVYCALACHGLLAARAAAPPELVQAWLAESYGWPKDNLYWWTLAVLKDDASLLRNLSPDTEQLFIVG